MIRRSRPCPRGRSTIAIGISNSLFEAVLVLSKKKHASRNMITPPTISVSSQVTRKREKKKKDSPEVITHRAHERPQRPLRVVVEDVVPQALEVPVVVVREAGVGPAGHAEAELGEQQGRGVVLALGEHEAVEEAVRLLQRLAVGLEDGVRDRELVRVPLPHVLARPRAPVDVALGAEVREVRRRLRAAHDDEHVRVRLVHARGGLS